MTRTWMGMLVVVGGLSPAMFGQQYPQQYPPGQVDPNANGQDRYNQYDNGQYAGNPGYPAYDGDPMYDDSIQGDYAPAPPPVPNYAYQRPPMPGPGYSWMDGYWNFIGGRYLWVGGSWMVPPYAGGYWVAPRYSSGRFFRGFWGGGRRDFNRGFVGNRGFLGNRGFVGNRGFAGSSYRGSVQPRQQSYRAPARGSGFGGARSRDSRPANRVQRQGRR